MSDIFDHFGDIAELLFGEANYEPEDVPARLREYMDECEAIIRERDALAVEVARLRGQLAEVQAHECQTHEELGAILGRDTSLADGARRMRRERDEAVVQTRAACAEELLAPAVALTRDTRTIIARWK